MKKAVGSILFLAIIILIIILFSNEFSFNKYSMNKQTDIESYATNIIKNQALSFYKSGDKIVGNDVLALLDNPLCNDINFDIKTLGSSKYVSYNKQNPYRIIDINNDNYIEPSAKFTISFSVEKNGVISKVIIEQKNN